MTHGRWACPSPGGSHKEVNPAPGCAVPEALVTRLLTLRGQKPEFRKAKATEICGASKMAREVQEKGLGVCRGALDFLAEYELAPE